TNSAPWKLAAARGALPPTFWAAHGWEIAVLALVLFLGVLLIVRLRRCPTVTIVIPPGDRARRELQQLRERKADAGLTTETSRIVRRFLVEQLALPEDELTT